MIKKPFFDRAEYKLVKKISDRLKEKHTLKNAILFFKYHNILINIAMNEYKNIGLQEDGSYSWEDKLYESWAKEDYHPFQAERCFSVYSNFDEMITALS